MATDVEIAAPAGTELEELFGLARSVFGDAPGWSDERVLAVLREDVVFVARERARPAGYVALRPESETATVVVDQLLVAPGHERRGVGRRLLAYAEGYAIAERAQALRIVAEPGNRPARGFYRRAGFVPVGAELLELVLPRLD